MAFIQILDIHTSDFPTLDALDREWERATEGRHTVRRNIVTRDRNDPNRYMIIVFFDSYESAMANSALAETAALAETMGALVDGPMSFHDLDVIEDRS